MVKYKVVSKLMDGANLLGYQLIDGGGNYHNTRKDEVAKLAIEGLIDNCKAVSLKDTIYLKGVGGRLSELPEFQVREKGNEYCSPNLCITGRIVGNKKVVGYLVADNSGKTFKLSNEKVWQLAVDKSLTNVEAKVMGSKKILQGVGVELRKLPIVDAASFM